MKKNYSKPIVLVETFTPNQFVASCKPEINEKYVVDPDALVRGIHVKYDIDQDGWYRQNDHNGGRFTSNHVDEGTSLYYIGRGWGVESQSGQITWPTPSLSQAEMEAQGVHYVYLFSNQRGDPNTNTGNIKVYGGSKIEEIVKNQS